MFLIPKMGAVGASIATVISYFVATFALVLFKETRRHTIYLIYAPFWNNPIKNIINLKNLR